MRQLLLSFCVVAFAFQAHAFEDVTTMARLQQVKRDIEQERTAAARLHRLEEFKDFLYERLNTIDVPDVMSTPDNDPRLEEYRSLTEFSGYVNMIQMKSITANTCNAIQREIVQSSGASSQTAYPEVTEALKIVQSLCK